MWVSCIECTDPKEWKILEKEREQQELEWNRSQWDLEWDLEWDLNQLKRWKPMLEKNPMQLEGEMEVVNKQNWKRKSPLPPELQQQKQKWQKLELKRQELDLQQRELQLQQKKLEKELFDEGTFPEVIHPKVIWKRKIGGSYGQLYKSDDKILVITDLQIECVSLSNGTVQKSRKLDRKPTLTVPINPNIFLIQNMSPLQYSLINTQTMEMQDYKTQEILEGSPLVVPQMNDWKIVSCLARENKGYGIFDYPFGIFSPDGSCKRIILDQPVQHFEVSGDKNIVLVTGPDLDVFRLYGSYYDSYRYWMRLLDLEGNELDKIELKGPMVSPFVITQQKKIVLFSDGCLLSYGNKNLSPLSKKKQDMKTCSSSDKEEKDEANSPTQTSSYSSFSKVEQT